MRIYLSGPMKGYPDFNYPLFHRVAGELRAQGHEVNNPAEFSDEVPFPLRKAFAAYCKYICEEAEAIVMLPGWGRSEGAAVEHKLAVICSLRVIEWADSPAEVAL